jgi:hypothetical protein
MWIDVEPEEITRRGLEYVQERINHYTTTENDEAQKFREAARENFTSDGDLEFDDDGVVSVSCDGGAYVQGWKWVENELAGIETNSEQAA